MGLDIKNPQVEELARAVAELTGESTTEAIGKALAVGFAELHAKPRRFASAPLRV